MTQRRCAECAHWHDKKDPECPKCGTPVSAFNKSLRTASLNNHLYSQAASVR